MNLKKNRIGFLLASIHTGSAVNMWRTLIQEASHSGSTFYIFPGGRLDAVKDSEYLRNSIYRLANPYNLDGLISWSSTIGNSVSVQELNCFHSVFAELPYVTIAHKMQGHPCVSFDAYTGMSNLVRHFVSVHHTKKIAFLRGPVVHVSAMDRYRAFCDVMKEAGLDVQSSPLVSDPFSWTDGEAAIYQLYHDRGLIPGQDFDVLIGSSDMMTFSAIRYLQKLGYRIPNDFSCAGFNDSVESRILGFSTVHMPYDELGLIAFSKITRMLSGLKKTDDDVLLPAAPVIRESCGCFSFPTISHTTEAVPQDRKTLIKTIVKIFRLDDTYANAVIEPIVSAMENRNETLLFMLFERALVRFFEQDMDILLLYTAFAIVKQTPFLSGQWIASLETRFYRTVSRVQNHVRETTRYQEQRLYKEVNSLKCDLLSARSQQELLSILANHFPAMGISSAALLLTESDSETIFAGGFVPGIRYTKEETFPADRLLPEDVKGFDSGVFLVQPLFMEKQPMGYFICSVPPYDGSVFEDLRSAISSTLNSIFLFEELSSAKQRAEQAEQAKTRFFANVGADLYDPLVSISNSIRKLKQIASSDYNGTESFASVLEYLEKKITEQTDKTGLVIDLTLSQTNELPFTRQLFHMESVTGETTDPYKFPLVYGDPDRLSQALGILCKAWNIPSRTLHPEKKENGLHIAVETTGHIRPNCWQRTELQLAERILLLSGCTLEKTPNGCIITYPWPCFSCKNAKRDAPTVEWNADAAGSEEWEQIYSRRATPTFAKSAFLCTTSCSTEELRRIPTFTALFEQQLSAHTQKNVLFIGTDILTYRQWIAEGHTLHIKTMQEFPASIRAIQPALIIFDKLDCYAAVEKIRMQPETVLCPIFILPEQINDEKLVCALGAVPRIIICNSFVAQGEEFAARARAVFSGDNILPPSTGALVKKAICYLNRNAGTQLSRWQIASHVHVNEDYLTRIFHKEMGLSPWDYLTRYRIYKASQMLLHTSLTIYEIAEKWGFPDQAYFCRVFKKICGIPPGKFRTRKEME